MEHRLCGMTQALFRSGQVHVDVGLIRRKSAGLEQVLDAALVMPQAKMSHPEQIMSGRRGWSSARRGLEVFDRGLRIALVKEQIAKALLGKGDAGLFRQRLAEEAVRILELAEPLGVTAGKAQALYVATTHFQAIPDALEGLLGLPEGLEKL
jgi:hypothetical protein